MKKMIVFNHKMNMEYDVVGNYIERLNQIDKNYNIVVCPSNIYLESFINYCNWGVGAQNVYYESLGNYTGEVSPLQLRSMGIEYALVGHFERKKYLKEDNEMIRKKLNACLDSNLIPILCFGESGNMEEIKDTLDYLLMDIAKINFIIFAYEPLEVCGEESIDLIEEDINEIYDYLYDRYGVEPNVIYGGGVIEKNINTLLKINKLSGILIGKVSSEIEDICGIIDSID